MRHVLQQLFPKLHLEVSARPGSAAPASGYMSQHAAEQATLVNDAING
jgi:2-oxoglutarate dehydrogenase E1 component